MHVGAALRSIWFAFLATRSIALLILINTVLLHSGQGEELVLSLRISPAFGTWPVFLAVLFWAAQSALWARLSLEAAGSSNDLKGEPSPLEHLFTSALPSIYALAIILTASIPFLQTDAALAAVTAVGIGGLTVIWVKSGQARDFLKGTSDSRLGRLNRVAANFVVPLLRLEPGSVSLFTLWPLATLTLLILASATFALAIAKPVMVAGVFGTLGTVFLASAVLTPLLATAVIITRFERIPVLLALLLLPFLLPVYYASTIMVVSVSTFLGPALAVLTFLLMIRRRHYISAGLLFSGIVLFAIAVMGIRSPGPWTTPHLVRHTSINIQAVNCTASIASCQSSITSEVDQWLRRQSSSAKPIVFVAAAGGGLRAAYWTASVLARLDDCVDGFDKSVFAISGVSGGSLGAATYAALARDKAHSLAYDTGVRRRQIKCETRPLTTDDVRRPKGWMQSNASDFLKGDLLAPIISNFLFRDLSQALIPIQIMPDRAAALELALEQAWTRTCESRREAPACAYAHQFDRSFFEARVLDDKMRADGSWIPVLLLNGTHEETGKRIVTSNIRVTGKHFFDTFDFFSIHNRDVALSTAVLNSARFPYVSPAGAMQYVDDRNVAPRGHIIDGGFFENNGAVTLTELFRGVLDELAKRNIPVRPLVIELLNDVEVGEDDRLRALASPLSPSPDEPLPMTPGAAEKTLHANELVSAAVGLYATRTARGVLASKSLAEYVVSRGGEHLLLRLCPDMHPSPPLGWLLTADSRHAMDSLIFGLDRQDQMSIRFRDCFKEVQLRLALVADFFRR